MKIGYVSGTVIPSRAASALHVVKMCQALANLDHRVTLFALENHESSENIDEYYGMSKRFDARLFKHNRIPGGGYRFAFKNLLAELRSPKCDVYYGRHTHGLLALSILKRPFAYEMHALPSSRHDLTLLRFMVNSSRCKGVVCISDRLASDAEPLLPNHVRISVLRDAADPAPTQLPAHPCWPGREHAPQIGYVGHLYPGKGMEIVQALARSVPDCDFHVVGGRDEDIKTWKSQGDVENLHYHGFVKHSELSGYYAQLDVALLPIQKQVWIADRMGEIGKWTSPLKAFEYMSYGLPIIASNVEPLREIFVHNETAILVEADNISDWQDALKHMVANMSDAAAIGQRARQVFEGHHTWDIRAGEVVRLLAQA